MKKLYILKKQSFVDLYYNDLWCLIRLFNAIKNPIYDIGMPN